MKNTDIEKQLADLDNQIAKTQAEKISVTTVSRSDSSDWWTTQNAMTMSSVVLLFGAIVIALCAHLMKNSKPSPEAVLRVFGTVLIIVGALFLVVAGYTDKQMAPVMGLLGTLAGYLLGKAPVEPESSKT